MTATIMINDRAFIGVVCVEGSRVDRREVNCGYCVVFARLIYHGLAVRRRSLPPELLRGNPKSVMRGEGLPRFVNGSSSEGRKTIFLIWKWREENIRKVRKSNVCTAKRQNVDGKNPDRYC